MSKVYCGRCGNTNEALFGIKDNHYYCRACIAFNKGNAEISDKIAPIKIRFNLPYKLTKEQEELANGLFAATSPIYVKAVCGAGKTEITYKIINHYLQKGMRVGIIIPRKAIVKELYSRLTKQLLRPKITAVYGGNDQELDGDIIILTTHQAYRYPKKFGLVIVDEYDAFPFHGNQTLKKFVEDTCYEKMVYLSATFTKEEINENLCLNLERRYHNHPLPVPSLKITNKTFWWYFILKALNKNKKNNKVLFIYVPTIKIGFRVAKTLKIIGFKNTFFSSKANISEFIAIKERRWSIIVTTTILERGITVPDLDVIVYDANHRVFDFKTLIQISGRVGRHYQSPDGDIIFLCKQRTKILNEVVRNLKAINARM